MKKKLVAYFSASGVTKAVAQKLAEQSGADLFEIVPKQSYTEADLDWNDVNSRSTLEMQNELSRPEILNNTTISQYDIIYLGYPIWWGVAPRIINTFLESYDFSGKTIITFATSGGSGMGSSTYELQASAPTAKFVNGKILTTNNITDFLANHDY